MTTSELQEPLAPWSVDADDRACTAPPLGDLVRVAATRWPTRTAVDDGTVSLTFGAFEERAQTLARHLAAGGVRAGDRVVVLTEKSALVPVVAVAAWKCGAVYVPLDGTAPPERLRRMLARLAARAVVALDDRPALVDDVPWTGRRALDALLDGPARTWRTVPHRPDDSAYVIFTSGSTGEPKGVDVTVANLTAYFAAHNEVLRFTPASRVLSLSPFHFDVSVEDTLLPLSLGAYVHQFRGVPAGPMLRGAIRRQRITHLIAVSTLLTIITQDGRQVTRETFPDLEMVMTGAEVCDPKVINLWKTRLPGTRVLNVYGPTEATIVCLAYEVRDVDPDRVGSYPIGTPLRGVEVRLVDDAGAPVGPGEVGELWVGGPQVMRGYVDQPDETARRVVVVDGVRYYRTGDLCSYDDDGQLVFRGRDDDEVKLAGRRIHLGEIRETALSCPAVERAAVAVVPRDGHDVIALLVVAPDPDVLDVVEARLDELLPTYMRPTLLGWSPSLAVASTGKTDEKDLVRRLADAAAGTARTRFLLGAADAALVADGAVRA